MAEERDANSRKLIDRVVPEEQWGPLHGLLATTYEMQPEFLETDLLPAILGLGAWDDRSWTTRIALERRLLETEVATVLMEASRYRGRPRSMRLRLTPVDLRTGGVLHAKVLVLLFERAVRLVVGSANLTEPGYRRNREGVVVLTATDRSAGDAALIASGVAGLQASLGPWLDASGVRMLDTVVQQLSTWGATGSSKNGVFAWSGAGRRLWEEFLSEWPADEQINRVTIASPFWSEDTGRSLGAMLDEVRRRGLGGDDLEVALLCEASVDPTGRHSPVLPISFAQTDWRAYGARVTAQAVDPTILPEELGGMDGFTGTRSLHAKVVLFEGAHTTQVYVGSGNFTARGWGFAANANALNMEAGVILRRDVARGDLASLLPPTTGKPVVLNGDGTGMLARPDAMSVAEPWPAFIKTVELCPHPEDESLLVLLVLIDAASREAFCVEIPQKEGCERILLVDVTGTESVEEAYRIDLAPSVLNRLLVEKEVRILWAAAPGGRMFPVNVDAAARLLLPVASGQGSIAESQLISYYQGRIAWEALFPDPEEGGDLPGQSGVRPPETMVDKSRIQSYQIREFVEALEGIRQDLRAAAQSEPSMRIALLGAVSPVALARSVMDAVRAGTRTPVAAAFQLVELLSCVASAADTDVKPQHCGTWQACIGSAKASIHKYLDGLSDLHVDLSDRKQAFSRYRRAVLNGGGEQ